MNLENKLKCLNDLAQKAQKQAKRTGAIMMPAIATVSLSASISYLVWSTFSQQTQLEAFDFEVQQLSDVEKRLTLEKDRLTLENAVNATRAQVIGGVLVFLTAFTAWRNLKVAEEKQITERFSKAVEMLSSTSMHTRLGGIYALERIANDSDKDYPQVMEVLCAFVREESPCPSPEQAMEEPLLDLSVVFDSEQFQKVREEFYEEFQKSHARYPPLRTDIQAVMTVISRRKYHYEDGKWETLCWDLRKTNLRKLQAYKANLAGINLAGAHLEEADLKEAHLEETNLAMAHLQRAHLEGAHLEGASLCETHLKEAYLAEAHLKGALLLSTDLSKVTDLTVEQVTKAHINGAVLPQYLQG